MRAGRLRHRVSIAGVTEVDDGHHGTTPTSVTVATRIPAEVRPLSGITLERARQIEPRSTHEIELRYRSDVKSGQTVTFHDPDLDDRDFEIVAPPMSPGERRRALVLLCRENERDRPSQQA